MASKITNQTLALLENTSVSKEKKKKKKERQQGRPSTRLGSVIGAFW